MWGIIWYHHQLGQHVHWIRLAVTDIPAMPTKRVDRCDNVQHIPNGGRKVGWGQPDPSGKHWCNGHHHTAANLQPPQPMFTTQITVSATHICVAVLPSRMMQLLRMVRIVRVWQLPVSTLSKVLVIEDSDPHQWTEIAPTPHCTSALLQDTAHPLAVGGHDDSYKPTCWYCWIWSP